MIAVESTPSHILTNFETPYEARAYIKGNGEKLARSIAITLPSYIAHSNMKESPGRDVPRDDYIE